MFKLLYKENANWSFTEQLELILYCKRHFLRSDFFYFSLALFSWVLCKVNVTRESANVLAMTRAGNLSWQTDQIKFSNFQFCTIFSSQNASTWIKQKLPRTSFYKSTFPEKDAKQDSIWHDFLTPPLCWSPDWQNRWVSCEVSLTQRCTPTLAAAAR